MKVAICFSGLLRTFEECWPSYEPFFQKYDCDLFVASVANEVLPRYHFKKMLFQEDEVMADRWWNINNHPQSPGQHMLRQFYWIQLANDLRRQYEAEKGIKYDFVVRTRTDCQIVGPLPDLSQCDSATIYIPAGNDNPEEIPGFGISDRFAIGGPGVMDMYSDKLKWLDEYMANPESWYFAEVILRWVLQKHNIPVKRFEDVVKVLRPNGRQD